MGDISKLRVIITIINKAKERGERRKGGERGEERGEWEGGKEGKGEEGRNRFSVLERSFFTRPEIVRERSAIIVCKMMTSFQKKEEERGKGETKLGLVFGLFFFFFFFFGFLLKNKKIKKL